MNDLPHNLKQIITRDYHISNQKISIKRYIDFDNLERTIKEFELLNKSYQLSIIKYLMATDNLDYIKNMISKIYNFDVNMENGILLKLSIVNNIFNNIEYLINIGANLYIEDNIIAKIAAQEGNIEIFQYILKNCSICLQDDLIFYAAISRHNPLEKIKFLDDYGINLHIYNDHILITAVQKNLITAVEYLLFKGCDVNAQNGIALRYSLWYNLFEITELLLKTGANTYYLQPDDLVDVINGKHFSIIELLIKYGLDVSIFNGYFNKIGGSDTHKTIKILIDSGINPIDLLAVCMNPHNI
ncbi:ankyrin repeat protein [Acanthamoeba polyphaga moumouvirus]|uniref:Ankyrin repeat protein n=1 Tax=Acanthamoeba polyphaga moumouvirus TaxID=1269028 RepID=L7RCW2_9VIRU|nr:ankyrin repeat protein [Acanthamoeba polyphaga moumouvirus]AGC02157.1 ankyrin repeat protein [Acanthamoeba polyphaga moumouvirus]